jgi:hypothetical protein
MLIDVAIPWDRNVIQKEAEKILKYKDLTMEIQRMWNVKARVIELVLNVMAQTHRLDFVFQRKGPVHSNRWVCQFS